MIAYKSMCRRWLLCDSCSCYEIGAPFAILLAKTQLVLQQSCDIRLPCAVCSSPDIYHTIYLYHGQPPPLCELNTSQFGETPLSWPHTPMWKRNVFTSGGYTYMPTYDDFLFMALRHGPLELVQQ
mgnify:CR=1 FL=1